MRDKRVVTLQDISCFGKCSITVALPVLSSMGISCSVIPTSVLSTHTGGFSGYTFRDLTEDMPQIKNHWVKEGIHFDAIYTGYLGSTKQIEYIEDIFNEVGGNTCLKIVDPAMADHGKLYKGFDSDFVEAMKKFCAKADYILPNITEAYFLTDTEFKTEYDREYVEGLIRKLVKLGCKNIIFTGISYELNKTGVVVYENEQYSYYEHEKLPKNCHGTGDIYASAFVGSLMRGKTTYEAAKIAADYVVECMKATALEENHWYGVKFEPVLGKLIAAVNKK